MKKNIEESEERTLLHPTKQSIKEALFKPYSFRTQTKEGNVLEEKITIERLEMKDVKRNIFRFSGTLIQQDEKMCKVGGLINLNQGSKSKLFIYKT